MHTAYVVHRLPGRLRLKIPAKRGNAGYFAALAEALRACPGVLSVEANATAASLLIHYPPTLETADLAAAASKAAPLDLAYGEPPADSIAETLAALLQRGDSVLRRSSGGQMDFRSASVLTLLGLALYQIARGEILQPAVPLLLGAMAALPGNGKKP